MSVIIKPCPFCGSRYTFVRTTHRKDNISNTQYEVYCAMCSATGGSRSQEEKAIQDWNSRSKITDNGIIEAEDTLTDLEKFKQLFDSMSIEYSINHTYYDDLIELIINKAHIYQSCRNTVKVMFTNDGKFVNFQGWGE